MQLDTSIGKALAQAYVPLDRKERAGLVYGRISEHLPCAYVVVGPGGIAVKAPKPHKKLSTQGIRGKIRGFSKASRRRMQHLLMSIDWLQREADKMTLTYPNSGWQVKQPVAPASNLVQPVVGPDRQAVDCEKVKYDLARFRQEMGREFEGMVSGAIWKMEFQKRGAPHFHLVVFWKRRPPIDYTRAWVAETWYRIVGTGDEKHLRAGTEVDEVYGTSGKELCRLMSYLVKYLGKVIDEDEPTGRIWGYWGKLPIATIAAYTLDKDAYREFTRRIRRWGKRKGRYLGRINANWSGFRVLGDWHLLLQLLLRGMEGVTRSEGPLREDNWRAPPAVGEVLASGSDKGDTYRQLPLLSLV